MIPDPKMRDLDLEDLLVGEAGELEQITGETV
jgi:hypothetical protein